MKLGGFLLFMVMSKALGALGVPTLSGELRYDEITWICSHNSMNAFSQGWLLPNQTRSIERQLKDGVHAQMWDVWKQGDTLVLRHGPSWARLLGSCPLKEKLNSVKKYLTENKEAILTLFFESYVSPHELAKALEQAKLKDLTYTHDVHKDWPTLESLRHKNTRLILFSDRSIPDIPWIMPIWKHCKTTPWEASSASKLQNTIKRGHPSNRLLIVNHFTSHPLPDYFKSLHTNKPVPTLKRYHQIQKELGQKPQFWVLDFYEQHNLYKLIP